MFRELIADRRHTPGDDMISTLVATELDDDAVLGLIMLFLGGGQETTAKALTTSVRVLGGDHDLQRRLREQPDDLPAFIEEALRWDNPVRGIFRQAVRDTSIGGVEVPEGALVQLVWSSGNRDETVFEDADVFDPDRVRPRPILSFGHGIHLCVGAHLARLQLRVGLEALLARFDVSLVDGQPFPYFRSQVLRGLSELWVDLEPR